MFLSQLLMLAGHKQHHESRGFWRPEPEKVPPVPKSTYEDGMVRVGVPNKVRKRMGQGVAA